MIRLALAGPLFSALWFRAQLSIGCYSIILPPTFSLNFVTLSTSAIVVLLEEPELMFLLFLVFLFLHGSPPDL